MFPLGVARAGRRHKGSVRHPLHPGVDGLTMGIAFLADHPWAFPGALALGLWFAVVLAPFEERELRALFGPAEAS